MNQGLSSDEAVQNPTLLLADNPLALLFWGEDPICAMKFTRTIVVSTWQKTPKEMKAAFSESSYLEPHRKMLEENGMHYWMNMGRFCQNSGAFVFVRPNDFDFASSLAAHENMMSKHIVYDYEYEEHIFATVMSIRSKKRPKLKRVEYIELPHSEGVEVGTVQEISDYESNHNARCVRSTNLRSTRSLTKYTEYLQRCHEESYSSRPVFPLWSQMDWSVPPAHPFPFQYQ